MAFEKYTEWENLVKKQIANDNIYSVLAKENLEGVSLKPYYTENASLTILPKVEESTHLVCRWYPEADENTFAFLVDGPYAGPAEKTIFVTRESLDNGFQCKEGNTYFSLTDPFTEENNSNTTTYTLDKNLTDRLLRMPFQRPLCIDICLHQNAGASIVQQLAIALLKTTELLESYPNLSLNKIVYRMAMGANYFMEIAKVRALKFLMAQLQKEYGLTPELPYIFAEATHRNKTLTDPENNLIRSTLEIGAAMIGGADAVFADNYILKEDSALIREISFKQSVVLAYESILNVFEDGAGGSYAIEDLTHQFCEQAWKLFAELENAGGYLASLQNGILQKMIAEQAIKEQQWVESGKIKLIGVNAYPKLEGQQSAEDMYSFSIIRPIRWAEQFGQ